MKKLQQGFIVPLLIIILAVLAIGGGTYLYETNKNPITPITITTTPRPVTTTTPPVVNPQPVPVPTATSTVKINQTIVLNGISITPLAIVSDSRCPVEQVTCVWVGTVTIKARVQYTDMLQDVTLSIGSPVGIFAARKITLESVLPKKYMGRVIAPTDYSFTFSIK